MGSSNSPTDNEVSDLFEIESIDLEKTVTQILKNFENLDISEIIKLYYQVINVNSLVKILRLNFEKNKTLKENKKIMIRVQETENFIKNQFNENLHPLVLSRLSNIIENSRKEIKNSISKTKEKTKKNLEIQAKMYEKLRQIMSTKEFVDQYSKVLNKNL